MLQHNPYAHSVLCPALARTLEAYETRELDADEIKTVAGCACQCRLIDDKPEKTAKAEK